MKPLISLMFGLFAHAVLAADGAASPRTIELYEQLPAIEEVAISPAGDKLAMVRVHNDARTIIISDVASGSQLKRLAAGNLRLGGIRWADQRYLIILTRNSGLPWSLRAKNEEKLNWLQGRVYDTVSGTARRFPFDNDDLAAPDRQVNALMGPLGVREIDGHDYLSFGSPKLVGNRLAPVIARMNLDTGEQQILFTGSEWTRNWLLDSHGTLDAVEYYNTDSGSFAVMASKDAPLAGPLTQVYAGHVQEEAPTILGFAGASGDLLISAPQNHGVRWSPLSLTDRKFKANLPNEQTGQFALKDRTTDQVFGGGRRTDRTEYFFFDADRAAQWAKVVAMFPNEQLILNSWSDDFTHLVLIVDGPVHGFSYQMVDLNAMQTSLIGNVFEGLAKEYPTETVHYKARDGQEVEGFLTLPAEGSRTALPLIVVVHDGPRGRDMPAFELWSQTLASQGYAVLRSNYRGSATTSAWENAAKGELAGKALTDMLDGVNDLASKGIVDPARVCIMGQGFGGYMALASVTLLPTPTYRCAISITGFANAHDTLKYLRGDLRASEAERTLALLLGVEEKDDAAVAAVSPVKHVSQTKAPVLLIHGRKDAEFPVTESEDFFDAMRAADKHVEIIKPEGDNDAMLRADSRKQMVEATVGFLEKYNPSH